MHASGTDGLIATIAALLRGVRHVAVGVSSPIPGAGALLARALAEQRGEPPVRLSILGSPRHNAFTDGGVELFDLAGQGRIDAFFLGGGQIDGAANINLVGLGEPPGRDVRWPGSFGSAYLYTLVPRVILFREEHTPRVLVPRVDFVSAAGPAPGDRARRGGPRALLTRRCLFDWDPVAGGFALASVHPGHDADEVRAQTGFDYAVRGPVPTTPAPDAATLALMRGRVRDELADLYPRFAAQWAGEAPDAD